MIRIKSKEEIHLNKTSFLYLQIGDLQNCVRYRIVSNLAINILLNVSFRDQLIHGIFPSKRGVVPWQLQPITILASPKNGAFNIVTPIFSLKAIGPSSASSIG